MFKKIRKKYQELTAPKKIKKIILNLCKKRELIKLNVGCGTNIRTGWINIDKDADASSFKNIDFIRYNCAKHLPINNECIDVIYSSHFLEHLEPKEALNFCKESFRVLKKGGIFRIALPNTLRGISAWFNEDESYLHPLMNGERVMFQLQGKPNNIDFLNYMIYQCYEHKFIYNESKVIDILQSIGFNNIYESSFNNDYDIDNELRKKYSFYVEAIK